VNADGRLAELTRRREPALERCELCGAPIGADHRHVLEPQKRELLCACRACALLFDRGGRYRLVPLGRRRVDGLELTEEMWEELRLPVDIAFFVRSGAGDRAQAYYPSPMGATESLLTFDLEVLHTLEPDVEALLVDRHKGAREHWIVPIDDCFRLVGLIRTHWQGLTGGRDVWAEIGRFFDGLERR
jgi:Family of unknown function (DUF5947)